MEISLPDTVVNDLTEKQLPFTVIRGNKDMTDWKVLNVDRALIEVLAKVVFLTQKQIA